jgi:hypothetical protein
MRYICVYIVIRSVSNIYLYIPKLFCESSLVVVLDGAIGIEVGMVGVCRGLLFVGTTVRDGFCDTGSEEAGGEKGTEVDMDGASVGWRVDDGFGDMGADDGWVETGTGADDVCCVLSMRIT